MAPSTSKRVRQSMGEACLKMDDVGKYQDVSTLDSLWSLSNHDEASREAAAFQLISRLIKKQSSSQEDGACSEVRYSLSRLIDGLSSTNKATRLGFYVALVELLRSFPTVLPIDDEVLPQINEHLLPSVGSNKKSINEAAIGQSLAYGALIRSGRIYENTKALQAMTEEFVRLFSRADFLQELCGTLLLELFSKLHEVRFSKCVFSNMKPLLSPGWEECSPDVFRIILYLTKQFPNTVNRSFLQQFWLSKGLLIPSTFERVSKILLKSTKTLPRVHPVCKEVIADLMGTADFPRFWTTFSEAAVAKTQKEQLFLLFELLKEAMNLVTKPSQIKDILQPPIIRTLMTCLANRRLTSHTSAVDLSKFIVTFASTSDNSDIQVEVLMTLLTYPGSIMFDQISSTPVISGIIPHLHEGAIVMLIALFKNIFLGVNAEQKQQSEVDRRTHRIAALQKLSNIVGYQSVKSNVDLTMDVIQFLILHAFFDQVGTSSEIPQCSSDPAVVPQDVHMAARDCFFKALLFLTSLSHVKSATELNTNPLNQQCQLLNTVLSYVKLLLENQEIVTPAVPLNDKIQSTFTGIFDSLTYLRKRGKRDGELQKSQAFQIMFLHFGLQLFVDNTRTIELIEDLHVCSKKAFEKFTLDRKRESTMAMSNGTDLEWMQVVVDVLLSILSENSTLLRNVANNVFALLVPQMSLAAFRQILDVLTSSVSEEDEDSVMDGETSPESEADDSESESSEEDVDDEEEDEESDNDDSNQSLRKSVKAALGDAAARSDAEDESDLDDEAMMRIDDSLSEAFKGIVKKRPGVSKDEESLLHFHNRCLDLLRTVISRRPSLDFVLESLPLLISAAEIGQNDKARQPFSQRALALIRHLMNIKKFQAEDCQTSINIADTLNLLISKFKNVLDHNVSLTFSELCTFLVRCAGHMDNLPPNQKSRCLIESESVRADCVQLFVKSMKDFFEDRHCAIPVQMFMCLISKNLEAGWTLAAELQKYWLNEDVKIFKKSQATYLLIALTSPTKQVSQIVTGKRWKKFASSCVASSVQELNKMIVSDIKQIYASNMLHLMCNILNVNKHVQLECSEADEIKEMIISLSNKQGVSKEIRKPMNKLALLINFQLHDFKRKIDDPINPKAKKQKLDNQEHEQTNGSKKKTKKKKLETE